MDELFFYNPWWQGPIPPALVKPYRRPLFHTLLHHLDTLNRVVVLKGPRRVGKTTLLYQLVAELLARGTDPARILFLTFDDPRLRDFDRLFDSYRTQILKEPLDRPIYLFLDEVQFLDNWQYMVKKYYDRNVPIRFVVSGSSATLIKKGSESLAGRTVEEVLLPFTFGEFFAFRTGEAVAQTLPRSLNIRAIKQVEERARILLADYLEGGGFPGIFEAPPPLRPQLLHEDIIEKALYRDVVAIHEITKPDVLERLFLYTVGATGQLATVQTLAKHTGLSRQAVGLYLTYLKQAYLVMGVPKYTHSAGKAVRSAEKLYCLDAGLTAAFGPKEQGPRIESVVAAHFFGQLVWYWKNAREVDFVVGKMPFPIEVKWKPAIDKGDITGLLSFCRKFACREAVLVTKETLETRTFDGITVYFLPLWVFLLFCAGAIES